MARWRLLNPHYINVGDEWEYKETSKETGRQARKVFHVPTLLDPKDVSQCNYDGEIVVGNGTKCMPKDYIFSGPPTPDMEPMDEEAQAISDSQRSKWIHPIESLPGNFSQSILDIFQRQVDAAVVGAPTKPISVGQIDPSDFKALQEQVAQLMARNAELEAKQPPIQRRA